MLCRTANELYWMARHIERADCAASCRSSDNFPAKMSASLLLEPVAKRRGTCADWKDVSMTMRLAGDKLSVVIRAASSQTLGSIEGARDAIVE